MATNIYGLCTGTSSSKYDFWVNVNQNSRDIEENTSNITVKVYLKRNDGSASSAYNLYESSNTVSLTLGGESKINKNITIDTRNNVTALLATWTGDVAHSSDGSLSLSIKSAFTMGNTTLSGGSLSGTFKGISIPRASGMTLSATTVNPGSTVKVTVSSASSAFSHNILWSLGDEKASINLPAGVLSSSFTIPYDWTEQVLKATSATLTVKLTTYNGSNAVGAKSYDLKFVIPAIEAYKPSFDISVTKNNGSIPATFNEYIKGITSVTVEPSSLEFRYGAEFAAVTITVGSVSIRKIPATFLLNDSGDVLITVAVRDDRGMLTVKTKTITVLDYEVPSVEVTSLFRCDSVGSIADLGTYASLAYNVGCSSLGGKNKPVVTVKYRKSANTGYIDLGEVSSSPVVFGDGGIEIGSTYVVKISVCDSITADATEIIRYISGGDIPFNIRKGGKGASFGKFSEKDSLLDVNWDMRVSGNMEILGQLNYESVSCECTENTTSMISSSRYYPALGMVYLRLRLETTTELAADTNHYIAVIPDRAPNIFTPLQSGVGFTGSNQSTAGIMYKNGNIVVRSHKVIPQGTQIYISGFYIADYVS